MIGTPEQDNLVRALRWAVVTTLRADGSPANSVVFYAVDGDALIFSTTVAPPESKNPPEGSADSSHRAR